jgi:predicted acetyltransferase
LEICKHDRLKRQCNECNLESEIAELKKEINEKTEIMKRQMQDIHYHKDNFLRVLSESEKKDRVLEQARTALKYLWQPKQGSITYQMQLTSEALTAIEKVLDGGDGGNV